jgi:UDP-N-acetylglucosamine 4,6-dehydratase
MRVLITGGTGFFGRALARALLVGGADRVVLYSRSESRQAIIASRFRAYANAHFFLGDVRDRERLEEAMWGCDTVAHCAALKRIDAVADNPGEVRKTNVAGSANVISAALAAGVKRVLMISSDKAAAPSTSYGASKAQMEHEAVASNAITAPRGLTISCTRWGNVLGSTGSVTEIWLDQLRRGAPLTVTDPAMSRFVITQRQAVEFCLSALAAMEGAEIFVPRLPAATVGDLAHATARMYGAVAPEIVVIGSRGGGEKLDEMLVTPEEAPRTWARDDAMIILPSYHSWRESFPRPVGYELFGKIYASDQPVRWIEVDELVDMLRETDPDD